MKLYISTPISARKERTIAEKLIAARHRCNMLKEIIATDVRFADRFREMMQIVGFGNEASFRTIKRRIMKCH